MLRVFVLMFPIFSLGLGRQKTTWPCIGNHIILRYTNAIIVIPLRLYSIESRKQLFSLLPSLTGVWKGFYDTYLSGTTSSTVLRSSLQKYNPLYAKYTSHQLFTG